MSYPRMKREDRVTTGDSGFRASIFRASTSRQNTFAATQALLRDVVQEFEVYQLSSSDLNSWLRGQFPDENEDFKIQVRQDRYVFYLSRKLTEDEISNLTSYRNELLDERREREKARREAHS